MELESMIFNRYIIGYIVLIIFTILVSVLAYYNWKDHEKAQEEYKECKEKENGGCEKPSFSTSLSVWLITVLSFLLIIVCIAIPTKFVHDYFKTEIPGSDFGISEINWAKERSKDGINAEVQPGKHGITLYFGNDKKVKQVDLATELPFPLGHPKTFKVPLATRGTIPTTGDVSIKVQPNAPKTEIITLDKYGTKMESILVGGKPSSGSGVDKSGHKPFTGKLPKVPPPPFSGYSGTPIGNNWQKESGYKKPGGTGAQNDPYVVPHPRPKDATRAGEGWKLGGKYYKQQK